MKRELDKAGQREEELKSMHNNYMLQVQSLINQKAIEAPEEKKKTILEIMVNFKKISIK